MSIKKLIFSFAALALFLGLTVAPANAQTTDINALLAQIAQLQAAIAQLQGGAPSGLPATACNFGRDLTIGSTGDDVTCLQNYLKSTNHFPAATASTGYFGSITKNAVVAWQTANSVTPTSGYFGTISQNKYYALASGTGYVPPTTPLASGCQPGWLVNPMTGVSCVAAPLPTGCQPGDLFSRTVVGLSCSTVTVLPAGCQAGDLASRTTGLSCAGGTTTTPTGITTPGLEGSLTVTVNATPGAGQTLREGDTQKAILGLKLEAKLSDIAVQRVKVDLGSATSVYTKVFKTIYVMDGSTILAQSDLNSSTVVKDGTTYYITLTGFDFIVPKNTTKVLTLALDAQTSIESDYAVSTYGLLIPANGVRGVDGAGLSQTGPASALSRRTVTVAATSLEDSATLAISANSGTYATAQVIADQNTDGDEYDKFPLLTFNLKAEKGDVKITDLVAGITRGVGTVATATTAYLYEGDTVVGSATVAGTSATDMTATFSTIDYIVPADTTKVLTLKVDIRDADTTGTTFIGDVTIGANVTAETLSGTAITETGGATGNTITILDSGIEASLVGSPTISCVGCPQSNDSLTLSTSTLTATFNIKVKAVGAAVVLPTVASDPPMFSKTGATNSFKVYVDGAAASLSSGTSTDYTIPSTCLTGSLTNGCTLAEGSEVIIPVTYTFPGRTAAGVVNTAGNHAVQLIKINYGATVTTSTFMSGQTSWRTNSVYAP